MSNRYPPPVNEADWLLRLEQAQLTGWAPSGTQLTEWQENAPRGVTMADPDAALNAERDLRMLEHLLRCLRVTAVLVERRMGVLRGAVESYRADVRRAAAEKNKERLFR